MPGSSFKQKLATLRNPHNKLHNEVRKQEKWDEEIRKQRKRTEQEEEANAQKANAARINRMQIVRPSIRAEPYAYVKLKFPTRQIRLMQIDTSGNDVICDLRDFDLARAPPYVAVSYTWGSPEAPRRIWINSRPHQVRRNCYSALNELILHRVTEYVWIDAICINQNDNAERAKQVQMMTAIFTNALWVAAIPESCAPFSYGRPLHDLSWIEFAAQVAEDPLFTRIWVVQELLVAREAKLLGNGNAVFLTDLNALGDRVANDANNRLFRLLSDFGKPQPALRAESLLVHYLVKYGDLSCSDPRDRIYALVPLSLRYFDVPALEADYDKTLFKVLLEFIGYICRLSQSRVREATSSFSDLLICLMKLVQSFELHVQHPEVREFLHQRNSPEPPEISIAQKLVLPSEEASQPQYHVSSEFQGICVNSFATDVTQFTFCKAAELSENDKESIAAMGFDLNKPETSQLTAVCHRGKPVLIATSNVQAKDIILTPRIGSMSWTFNFIFRQLKEGKHTFRLVGQAVPLKGSNKSSLLSTTPCCSNSDCPARRPRKQVYLHAHDILTVALLARAPVQRLANAITNTYSDTYAVLTS